MDFSKRLIILRKERKFTQQQMADIIGIHVSQIKRYEASETQPSLEVLRKIALTLNVSADLLLFNKDERGTPDEFKMQFEALNHFNDEEKKVAKVLLDSLILKHTANRLSAAAS
ncbi:MAG: helix-turn-helix transcriptional regulator [Methylococcales bacterium]|jgi:transcriptional regulator with XRE-family HTH domain|nr:helix-turn-helix transcriptional regulator [Methylococcales bacterium]